MKKYLLLAGFLAGFLSVLSAQNVPIEDAGEVYVPTYVMGDQTITLNMGTYVPLFFLNDSEGIQSMNLQFPIGLGAFVWETYVNNHLKMGGELNGSFANSKNEKSFFMVPLVFRTTWEFRYLNFAFPVRLGLGFVFDTYGTDSRTDFILKPGVSAYWGYNSSWSFGLNMDYWIIPQYMNVEAGQEGSGHFLEFSLSALYHL